MPKEPTIVYESEMVRDLDVLFVLAPKPHPLTLRAADTLDINPDTGDMRILFAATAEEVVIKGRNILYYSIRPRLHKTAKPAHAPGTIVPVAETESGPFCEIHNCPLDSCIELFHR